MQEKYDRNDDFLVLILTFGSYKRCQFLSGWHCDTVNSWEYYKLRMNNMITSIRPQGDRNSLFYNFYASIHELNRLIIEHVINAFWFIFLDRSTIQNY